MSGFWRMQCAGDSFDITAKVSLENPNSIQRLSFKYIKNVLALFTLPGPCRERKGVEDIVGEIHFSSETEMKTILVAKVFGRQK